MDACGWKFFGWNSFGFYFKQLLTHPSDVVFSIWGSWLETCSVYLHGFVGRPMMKKGMVSGGWEVGSQWFGDQKIFEKYWEINETSVKHLLGIMLNMQGFFHFQSLGLSWRKKTILKVTIITSTHCLKVKGAKTHHWLSQCFCWSLQLVSFFCFSEIFMDWNDGQVSHVRSFSWQVWVQKENSRC